ncbi:ATP-binding cassette domain-containing protein [Alkalibacillus almallahensis]|uniref:ATP-binding cassette domain-containing protein n=1 Tax=Alkalibacillus almallahensis TaxID=1379154 RepID=UPI001420FBB8|nr:ABC transporter ATP-binding protein [Alkalibacillus almallahensis]NIK13060.1 ABC-2 type transport system ATP-binding protein [Alkalibacillus almallahensis]
MAEVELSDVTKSYRNQEAISSLTLNIPDQSITGLIGPNGAGKTTLLNLIAGIEAVTDGEVSVFGNEPLENLSVAANLFYVHEDMMYPQDFRISEVYQAFKKIYPNWDQALAENLSEHFNLSLKQMPRDLSKGQASTLNAIIGLAVQTPVTMFDEPTTGMDYGVRRDFYRALLKSYIAHPRTIILSSHLLNELEDLLEHVILLDHGELELMMEMDELKQYAVALVGEYDSLIDQQSILYQDRLDLNQQYWVIKHPGETTLQDLRRHGFTISPVAPSDLCVYLTQMNRGDVDHVF